MPATYAHYRMGQQVRRKIVGDEKEIIEKYTQLYLIGLHGPDIFFYYRPFNGNQIRKQGFQIHKESGKAFFTRAKEIINKQQDPEPYLAYIYGVLNHFALDVSCHGYVAEAMESFNLSHPEVETEFDRLLLVTDHKNPITKVLTSHLKPSLENGEVIAPFYPGTDAKIVKKALQGMILYNALLIMPFDFQRKLAHKVFSFSSKSKDLEGMIMSRNGNPVCVKSNEELKKLYLRGKKRAEEFINGFRKFTDGEEPLPSIFNYSFGSVLIEK